MIVPLHELYWKDGANCHCNCSSPGEYLSLELGQSELEYLEDAGTEEKSLTL
jgi:hypothetical protein